MDTGSKPASTTNGPSLEATAAAKRVHRLWDRLQKIDDDLRPRYRVLRDVIGHIHNKLPQDLIEGREVDEATLASHLHELQPDQLKEVDAYVKVGQRVLKGPLDPNNPMWDEYVERGGILGLVIWALAGLAGDLVVICLFWGKATHKTFDGTAGVNAVAGPPEGIVALMVLLMGALGGFLHVQGSLASYIGKCRLTRNWVVYYVMLPFTGAGLAFIFYLLLRTGVLAMPNDGAANTTAYLNLVVLYAISALSGLFSGEALDMLGRTFKSLFQAEQSKNGNRTEGAKSELAKNPGRS